MATTQWVPVDLDWGDGTYELMAAQLVPAARRALDFAAVGKSERVLDIGCGTGNVALLAARRADEVCGVDPAPRLLEVARERAATEGSRVDFVRGTAADPGVDPASFDVAVAVFSMIFAPDPAAAVAGVFRTLRPGGRMVVTSWRSEGPIHASVALLFQALIPEPGPRPASPWSQPESLRALLARQDANVEVVEESLAFTAPSAAAWFEQHEAHHPFWRMARRALTDRPDDYHRVRQRSIELLEDGNESRGDFRTTSRYLMARVELPPL